MAVTLQSLTDGTNEDARFLVTVGSAGEEWYNAGTSVGSLSGDADLPPLIGRVRWRSSTLTFNRAAGESVNMSTYQSGAFGKRLFLAAEDADGNIVLEETRIDQASAGGGFFSFSRGNIANSFEDLFDALGIGDLALFVFADADSVEIAADPSGAPTASFTHIVSNLTVQFTDTSSGSPTSWDWDFGDGTPNSSAQNPTHVYASAGTRTVELTATNDDGSDTFTSSITTTNPPPPAPVASFTDNTTFLAVDFTDTSTGTPTSWSWAFGDGATSTDQNPSHTYATDGDYDVTLVATNAGGSNSSTRTITVAAAPPVAPVAAFTHAAVNLTVTFTDTSTETPTSWLWDFGDGTTSTNQNPVHTFATVGSHTVSLVATNAGGSSTDSQVIVVSLKPTTPDPPTLTPHDTTLTADWQYPVETGGSAIERSTIRWRRRGNADWKTAETAYRLFLIPNLENGITYEVQVQVHNRTQSSSFSTGAFDAPVARIGHKQIEGHRIYFLEGYDGYMKQAFSFEPDLPYRYRVGFEYGDENIPGSGPVYDDGIRYDQPAGPTYGLQREWHPMAYGFRYDTGEVYTEEESVSFARLNNWRLGIDKLASKSAEGFAGMWVEITQDVHSWNLNFADVHSFRLHSGRVYLKEEAAERWTPGVETSHNLDSSFLIAFTVMTQKREIHFHTAIGEYINGALELKSWMTNRVQERLTTNEFITEVQQRSRDVYTLVSTQRQVKRAATGAAHQAEIASINRQSAELTLNKSESTHRIIMLPETLRAVEQDRALLARTTAIADAATERKRIADETLRLQIDNTPQAIKDLIEFSREDELTWTELLAMLNEPQETLAKGRDNDEKFIPPPDRLTLGQAMTAVTNLRAGFSGEIPNGQIGGVGPYDVGHLSQEIESAIPVGDHPGTVINQLKASSRQRYTIFQYFSPLPGLPDIEDYVQYPSLEDTEHDEEVRRWGSRPWQMPQWLGVKPDDRIEELRRFHNKFRPQIWEVSVQATTLEQMQAIYLRPFKFRGISPFSPREETEIIATPIAMSLWSNGWRIRAWYACAENNIRQVWILGRSTLGQDTAPA